MANLDEILLARQERIDEMHRLRPGRTALLVIDMQRRIPRARGGAGSPRRPRDHPQPTKLIEACRRQRVPVIFTRVRLRHRDPLPARRSLRARAPAGSAGRADRLRPALQQLPGPARCQPGPNSVEIVPELAPRPEELVVRGHTYDKFYGTPLDLALRSQDIRYLVIAGVVTEICVNCTLLSAANRDYRVTAVTDGVASPWPELQEACFEIWRRKFARLRTVDEVISEIREETPSAGPVIGRS